MRVVVAFPVSLMAIGSLAAIVLHRRVSPWFAGPVTATLAVGLTGGVLMTAVFYALAAVEPLEATGWCQALLGHDVHPGPAVGVAAAVVALTGFVRIMRWWMQYRRSLRHLPIAAGSSVAVLDEVPAVAYAHPGGRGTIVVSRGLLDQLTPRERLVVVAHERAHLDQHHPRLLVAGELAAAGCPLVAPLVRALRWSTERAADEATAAIVADRHLVATTIAKAAVAAAPAHGAAVSGADVTARVDALLRPPRRSGVAAVVLAAALLGTVGALILQAHHLAEWLTHTV